MDALDISISYDKSSISDGIIAVMVTVRINGKEMAEILDIDNFFESIRNKGMYPLFTCTCGIFECAGYYVYVDYTETSWVLKNSYSPTGYPNESRLIDSFEYHIPWENVMKTGSQIIKFLLEEHKKRPDFKIHSGTLGIDISYWIPEYIRLWQKHFPEANITENLINQLSVNKKKSCLAKSATKKWLAIPEELRKKIENEAWCQSCRVIVKIVDFNVRHLGPDLFLYGKCGTCGRRTVRAVVEV